MLVWCTAEKVVNRHRCEDRFLRFPNSNVQLEFKFSAQNHSHLTIALTNLLHRIIQIVVILFVCWLFGPYSLWFSWLLLLLFFKNARNQYQENAQTSEMDKLKWTKKVVRRKAIYENAIRNECAFGISWEHEVKCDDFKTLEHIICYRMKMAEIPVSFSAECENNNGQIEQVILIRMPSSPSLLTVDLFRCCSKSVFLAITTILTFMLILRRINQIA